MKIVNGKEFYTVEEISHITGWGKRKIQKFANKLAYSSDEKLKSYVEIERPREGQQAYLLDKTYAIEKLGLKAKNEKDNNTTSDGLRNENSWLKEQMQKKEEESNKKDKLIEQLMDQVTKGREVSDALIKTLSHQVEQLREEMAKLPLPQETKLIEPVKKGFFARLFG